jgi:hypothetical protein
MFLNSYEGRECGLIEVLDQNEERGEDSVRISNFSAAIQIQYLVIGSPMYCHPIGLVGG